MHPHWHPLLARGCPGSTPAGSLRFLHPAPSSLGALASAVPSPGIVLPRDLSLLTISAQTAAPGKSPP